MFKIYNEIVHRNSPYQISFDSQTKMPDIEKKKRKKKIILNNRDSEQNKSATWNQKQIL